jgi:hypothetical protein
MSTQNDKSCLATPTVWHLAKIAPRAIFKRSVLVGSASKTNFYCRAVSLNEERLPISKIFKKVVARKKYSY